MQRCRLVYFLNFPVDLILLAKEVRKPDMVMINRQHGHILTRLKDRLALS